MHVSGEKGPAGMPEQKERLTADCSGDQLKPPGAYEEEVGILMLSWRSCLARGETCPSSCPWDR